MTPSKQDEFNAFSRHVDRTHEIELYGTLGWVLAVLGAMVLLVVGPMWLLAPDSGAFAPFNLKVVDVAIGAMVSLIVGAMLLYVEERMLRSHLERQ